MSFLKLKSSAALSLFLLGTAEGTHCVLTAKKCNKFPHFGGSQFRDSFGEDMLDVGRAAGPCLRRAEDFHHWCGNGRGNNGDEKSDKPQARGYIAATHKPTMTTQIYFPDACDPEWSLFGRHCYIHVWKKKDWTQAEAYCNEKGGNLCSIHGKEENEFVFTLTHGLSAWIGYHDSNQDEKKEWTDNSKSDFENMVTNCTGRETEPDCAPEEKAQQWYDFRHDEGATWVCKKPARLPMNLIRNTTALEQLPGLNWDQLRLDENLLLENRERELKKEEGEGEVLTEEEEDEREMGERPEKREAEALKVRQKKCINC